MIPPRQEFEDWARFFIERKPKEQTNAFPAIGYEIAQNVNAFEELTLIEEGDKKRFADEFELYLLYNLQEKYPDPTRNALKKYRNPSALQALHITGGLPINSNNPYERTMAIAARGLANKLSAYYEENMNLIYGIDSFVSAKAARQPIVSLDEQLRQSLAPLFITYRKDITFARSLEQKLYS